MDGFHFDNAVLEARGLIKRKGAPETFDAAGFYNLLERLRADAEDVAIPVFDRKLDLARAGGRVVTSQHRILIVEGNYLLLRRRPWSEMRTLFDLSVFLSVPAPVLEARLIQRWLDHDLPQDEAEARARGNDLPNAMLVLAESDRADWQIGY